MEQEDGYISHPHTGGSDMTIKNKAFREAMEKAGLGAVQLEKEEGYFWIWSEDDEMSDRILSLESDSILVESFNHLSIKDWVEEIKELLGFHIPELLSDLHEANLKIADWGISIVEKESFYTNYHPGFIMKTCAVSFSNGEELEAYMKALKEAKKLTEELNQKYKNHRVIIEG